MSQHQALKHRATKSYGSTDSRFEVKDGESDDEDLDQCGPKFNKKLNEVRSMTEFYEWLTTDMWSKLHILFFFISMLIPFIIAFYYFILHEYNTSYVVAGIYGICASLYAMNHFRTLFALRNEVNTYQTMNVQFRKERSKMDKQIKTLRKGKEELRDIDTKLQTSNLKMIDMIKKFQHLEDRLNALNISNNETISDIGHRADALRSKYYDVSLQQQRHLLWKLFERLEFAGTNKSGLTKEDYETFYELVPKQYQERFDRLGGFPALLKMSSKPQKNYVDAKDFERALSIYAKMHVENVDLVFKLDAKKRKNQLKKGQSFLRGVTIIETKQRKGFYLSKEAVWAAAREQESSSSRSASASPIHISDITEPVFGRQKRINYQVS